MGMTHLIELLCLMELTRLMVTSCGSVTSSGMSHLVEIIIFTGNLGIQHVKYCVLPRIYKHGKMTL